MLRLRRASQKRRAASAQQDNAAEAMNAAQRFVILSGAAPYGAAQSKNP